MRNKGMWIVLAIILLGVAFWGIGYIPRYPIWVDDFSGLGNDVFSKIIINGRYEKPDYKLGRMTGVPMLDSTKISAMSESMFMGRHKTEVIKTFNTYGSGCHLERGDDGREVLMCKFNRLWKTKNIGMSTGGSPYFITSVEIVYKIEVDNNGLIRGLKVKIIDVSPHETFDPRNIK